MFREELLTSPFRFALGLRPVGSESRAWRNFGLFLRRVVPLILAGSGKVLEEAILEASRHVPFVRLPRWTDLAVRVAENLFSDLPEEKRCLWTRRFISDFAGLEDLLREVPSALILERMAMYYSDTIATWPSERLDVTFPLYVPQGLPEGPFRSVEEEAAELLRRFSPFTPSEEFLALVRPIRQALAHCPEEPILQRAFVLEFLFFSGIPRLPLPACADLPSQPFSRGAVALCLGILG